MAAKLVDGNALVVNKATIRAVLQDWLNGMFAGIAPRLMSFDVDEAGDYTLRLTGPLKSGEESKNAE